MSEIRQDKVQRILRHKLVVIVRLAEQESVGSCVSCLVEGGAEILEITSNTPGYCEEIRKARKLHPELLIGAGTVINVEIAKRAIAAGAQFLVTPNVSGEITKLAHQHDVPVLMGALTPTEIATAIAFQADIVKLFPAGEMGPGYVRSIKAPFDTVPFFAVGGIDIDNLSEWFEAGVSGVGVGSQLSKAVGSEEQKHVQVTFVKDFMSVLSDCAEKK